MACCGGEETCVASVCGECMGEGVGLDEGGFGMDLSTICIEASDTTTSTKVNSTFRL